MEVGSAELLSTAAGFAALGDWRRVVEVVVVLDPFVPLSRFASFKV